MKRILLLILTIVSAVLDVYPLSEQQQLAEKTINSYYDLLGSLTKNPTYENEQKIRALFEENGNVVFNDLYVVERKYGNGLINENQNADINDYMSTIRNLWAKGHELSIVGKIDNSSFIEEIDPEIVGNNKKTIWVTAAKSIVISGFQVDKIKETFKIKEGKIQSIRTPEEATFIINFNETYCKKEYDRCYNAFLRKIALNQFDTCKDREDLSMLYLVDELLSKGKVKSIPSNVQKWLSLFYEAKYGNSKYMLVNKEYHKEDLQYLTKDTTLKYPFVHGLMPVYKIERPKRGSALAIGDKKYAFMSEYGKMVTPYKFLFAEPFSKEYKVARVGIERVPLGRGEMIYGIINTDGEQLVKNAYISIRPFKNGLAAVRDIYYRWGFINTQGEEVVQCQYSGVTDYNCGWYGFSNGSKSTYVNLQGEYINSESYYGVWTFAEDCDLACVSKKIGLKEFIGCIDSRGREIIPTKYYSVKINGKEGTVTLQENRDSPKITKKISDYR